MLEPTRYTKISALRKTSFQASQIWAASDHLLSVTSTFGIENYRRFPFREIEALIIRSTPARTVINAICAGILLVCAGLAGWLFWLAQQPSGSEEASVLQGFGIFFGIVAVICLVAIIWNSLKGPTVAAFLQTRAGLHPLPMLRRRGAAHRFRDRFLPLMSTAP